MKHIQTLIEMAIANPGAGGAKIASAIIKRNRVLAFGINRYKTHPMQARFSAKSQAIHLHAEIDAIQRALREYEIDDLIGATMLIVRVFKNEELALAKPCLNSCVPALKTFNFRQAVYSTSDGFATLSMRANP